MSDLQRCPKCGQKRFDPWCGACERRACGYVKPDDSAPTTALPSPDSALRHVDFRMAGSTVLAVFCNGWRGVVTKAGVPTCAGCGEDLSARIKAAA